jgi:hypothetical protein
MACRPNSPKDEALTENDLRELQRRLSLLSMSRVGDFYRESHRECCLNDRTFPAARSITAASSGMEAVEEVAETGQMSESRSQTPETKRLTHLLHPTQRAWEATRPEVKAPFEKAVNSPSGILRITRIVVIHHR